MNTFYYDANGYVVPDELNAAGQTFLAPSGFLLPKFVDGAWAEASIPQVVFLDEAGYVTGEQNDVDPRDLGGNYTTVPKPLGFLVPRLVADEWIDEGIRFAVLLDDDGYAKGEIINFDPRDVTEPYTIIPVREDFIAPRYMDGEWIETGHAHAWQIDDEGYFVIDLFDYDPREGLRYTATPCPSGVFRRPRFVEGAWIEGNPATSTEKLASAKKAKHAYIDRERITREGGGAPFNFSGVDDVIQTRFERDYINISGITMQALLLQARGIDAAVIEFRAESNTTYLLTPANAIALGEAVAAHSQQIYATSWALKDQLEQAETVAEVESIVWP